MSQEVDKEWNDLTVELMNLSDRMAVVLKRLQEIDKKTIKTLERGPLHVEHKQPIESGVPPLIKKSVIQTIKM